MLEQGELVRVTVDGRDAGSCHITAKRPAVPVNLSVVGSVLTIRLDPGVNGPIMDRLRLVEPVVLVRRPARGDDSVDP